MTEKIKIVLTLNGKVHEEEHDGVLAICLNQVDDKLFVTTLGNVEDKIALTALENVIEDKSDIKN